LLPARRAPTRHPKDMAATTTPCKGGKAISLVNNLVFNDNSSSDKKSTD